MTASKKSRRQLILDTTSDLAIDFVAYDRRDDEDLGRGEIEEAITKGEITVDEIVAHFRESLKRELAPPR